MPDFLTLHKKKLKSRERLMFSGFLLLPNFKRGKKNDKNFFNEEIITLIKVNDARHARFFYVR